MTMRRIPVVIVLLAILALLLCVAVVSWAADFGCRATTPIDLSASPENLIVLATMDSPANGIVDSLGFLISGAAGADFAARMALYKMGQGTPTHDSLKDSTAAFTIPFGGGPITYSRPVIGNASIYASVRYGVTVWAGAGPGNPSAKGTDTDTVCVGNGVVKEYRLFTLTYSGNRWPDTLHASVGTGYLMAYVVYHTTATGGQSGRRRRIQVSTNGPMSDEDIGPWADQTKTGTR